MKEHLYNLTDQQIIHSARTRVAEQRENGGDLITHIRQEADLLTQRASTKAERITQQLQTQNKLLMEQIPPNQKEQVSQDITDLVTKRERSRAGLASYLIGREHIRREHVKEDGSLDIDTLRQTEYFQGNAHFLDALETYQLSKKSKLRRDDRQEPVPAEPIAAEPAATEPTPAKKEKLFKRVVSKIKSRLPSPGGPDEGGRLLDRGGQGQAIDSEAQARRGEGKKSQKTKKKKLLIHGGTAVAGVAMLGGLAVACSDDKSEEPVKPPPTTEPENPIVKPPVTETPPIEPPPSSTKPKEHKKLVYEVKRGDSLSTIAERYYGKEVWKVIYKANKSQIKDPNTIYPGQDLIIPKTVSSPEKPQPPKPPQLPQKEIKYKIKKGDTLSELAQRFKTDIPSIMEKNKKIKDADVIFACDILVIPRNETLIDSSKIDPSLWGGFLKEQSVHGGNWIDFLKSAKKISHEENYPLSVLVGQAVIETGHGKSEFAVERNNYFGYKAYDSSPRSAATYQSKEASIRQYIDLIRESPRYKQAYASKENPKKMVHLIKQGGYATDPHYVDKVTTTQEFQTLQKI